MVAPGQLFPPSTQPSPFAVAMLRMPKLTPAAAPLYYSLEWPTDAAHLEARLALASTASLACWS